jgi:N-acetylglucosamine-6-sulfatase
MIRGNRRTNHVRDFTRGIPRVRSAAFVVAVAVLALLAGSAASSSITADAQGAPSPPAPNVLVVMTDDQTSEAMRVMPETASLIGEQGAVFENSFASFPLCCPSRATFLTGQYAHNHKVLNNIPPQGGFDTLDGSETLPVWLQRSGYYTGLIGKYLNGYEDSAVGVPPGYSEWHGQKTQNAYYGYDLLEDGQLVRYGDPDENPVHPADPASYSTDVYTDKAVDFIGRRAPLEPFFLWVAYNAPHNGSPEPRADDPSRCHGTVKPAARDLGTFEGEPLPIPPSFNEVDVSDKPRSVRELPALDAFETNAIHNLYRCELESLLAVDEGVRRIFDALQASGELDNTLLIFTSDNGMMHGQHRIPFDKNLPYEESIRVPLMIRGPGVPAGVTVRDLAANVDLAPTILEATGAHPRIPQDGHSLLPSTGSPGSQSGRALAIEGNRYRGLRTSRYLYLRYIRNQDRGTVEFYDLDSDPYELQNLHGDDRHAEVERSLARLLRKVQFCDGPSCDLTPQLRLRVDDRRRQSGSGSCRGQVAVTVVGKAADDLIEARFSAQRGKRREDHGQPYRTRFTAGQLDANRRVSVRAAIELIDGRRMTLQRGVDRC